MLEIIQDFNNKTFSLYIHIPFCISKCKYCDFFSVPCNKISDDYVKALCNEIIFYQHKYYFSKWESVYIGGGTPSLLTQNQLISLFDAINIFCRLDNSKEFTIELNPDDVTLEFIDFLNKSPVNRISCGIQSFNDKSLNFVARRADAAGNLNAISVINEYWKGDKSFDLICGLPFETEKSFFKGLNYLLQTSPEHISIYSLTIEEATPLGALIEHGEIEYDYDFADSLWLKAKDFMAENGYEQYEVSNFAKNGKISKHNLVYWSHGNYIGCGSGATGTVYSKKGTGFRWTNTNNLTNYITFWEQDNLQNKDISDFNPPIESESIDFDTSVFEFFMMGLRKSTGISERLFLDCFKQPLPEKFLLIFDKWKNDGMANITILENDRLFYLNKKGIIYLNKFLEELEI